MTEEFPPQVLQCPDPTHCPIIDDAGVLPWRVVTIPAGGVWHRCYAVKFGYDEPNPGYGDSRFSPFDDADGRRVAVLYAAESETAALLETVLRDLHHGSSRIIYLHRLAGSALVRVTVPRDLLVVDLRDRELSRLGIPRSSLVSGSAEHYPCTRKVAATLHARGVDGERVQGLIWHSRQAELADAGPAEVLVVFTDRCAVGRGGWPLAMPGVRYLVEGSGRDLLDEIAESIDAVIEHD